MTACFHLPSVTCENCAHLERGSVKSPWVGVVTSGTTITLSAGTGLLMPSEHLRRAVGVMLIRFAPRDIPGPSRARSL